MEFFFCFKVQVKIFSYRMCGYKLQKKSLVGQSNPTNHLYHHHQSIWIGILLIVSHLCVCVCTSTESFDSYSCFFHLLHLHICRNINFQYFRWQYKFLLFLLLTLSSTPYESWIVCWNFFFIPFPFTLQPEKKKCETRALIWW